MKLNVVKADLDIQELSNIILSCYPVTHKEKGHHYQVMSIVKSKHKDTGEWYEAVIYRQIESGEFFVRSIESFIENFVKVIYPYTCGIEIQTIKILKEIKEIKL